MRQGSNPRGGRAKKGAALVGTVALAASVLVGLGPAARAQAVTPEPVMSTPAGEFQPVRDNGFLAWQRNTKKRPNRFNVFAMPDGEDRFKVNAGKTNAANGGIDGTTLVYQEYKGGQSDLKFFDLLTQKRTGPPKGVNTKNWEYWPRMSGQWILFGRLLGNGDRKLILYDRNARTGQQVDKTTSPNGFLAPGQVSGDYAVWYKCPPSGDCDVFRYQISTDDKFKIPNPGNTQHAPSVTPQGTVYFVRNECGVPVRIMRYPLGGPATVLTQLPRGGDVSSTRTHIADNGAVELFYEHNVCQDAVGSDLWKITEAALFDLSVTQQGGGDGTVTSSPAGVDCGADCAAQYEDGTTVTLTAASQGQSSFKSWGGACSGTQNTCTLTMDEAKDVIANFDPPPNLANLAVTKTGPGSGTVTSSPAGVNCGADCSENYPVGTSVTLTASAAAKSTFGGWGGACTGTGTTCTLTMDAGKTATANFNTVTHTMTVTRAGNGAGTVTSSPSGINCGGDCTENFAIDSSVTLTAAATGGSNFTGWTGACTGNSTVCTVTMNQAKSATASFTLSIHNLNVTKSGTGTGTVTSAPAGISCGADCNEGYDHGTSVTLTAAPAADSVVGTWTGCNSTPTPDTCTVTMDAAKNVDAGFNIATRTLTVTKDGNGTGTVTSGDGLIDCGTDCTEGYPHGTVVELTAAPDANTSVTWTNCTVDGVDPNKCSVTMDADKTVTATFTLATRTLTVITDGTGTGTVTSSPAGITCGSGGADCTEGYPHGQAVQLTAAPDAGASVTWTNCTVDGVDPNKCDVTMDADKTVTATFTAAPPPPGPWTLTVDGQGDGTGNVMSNPAGINCGQTAGVQDPPPNDDCTEAYSDGTVVELTASGTHAPPTWSGCTVDGVDPNKCSVTMDADKLVTATFDDPLVSRRRSVTGTALILGYPTVPSGSVVRTRAVHDSWLYLFSG